MKAISPNSVAATQGAAHAVWPGPGAGAPDQALQVMTAHGTPAAGNWNESACQSEHITIPQLVGQVYEAAPTIERCRLLEQLMKPLGVLSLVAVAGGVFAKLRFRSGWQDFHVRLEDTHGVHAADVIALVDYVQQVSIEAVDGLAQTLGTSPVMTGSAAAALLVTVLLQRARTRSAQEASEPPATIDRR